MYTKPPSTPSTGAEALRDDGIRQSAHAAANSHMIRDYTRKFGIPSHLDDEEMTGV
jgi:hypothetical protein